MPLKKTYLKSKDECKVTFRLPKDQAANAQSVTLVGDFNDWQTHVSPMRKLKSGEFTHTINLPKNKRYAFRYLLDDEEWQNDWAADAYTPNNLTFDDNSIVEV